MSKERHARTIKNRRLKGKVPVIGVLERGGEVRANVIGGRRKPELQAHVRNNVESGSSVYTDALRSYEDLHREGFKHEVIDHAKCYAQGKIHTNGLENFWSILKRGLKGTYISVEPFHLFRYLDEQAFRYNNRGDKENKITDGDRFDLALSQIAGKRLTFAEVTGKVGSSAN